MPFDPIAGGYRPLPMQEIYNKWAWFPVKSTSGKWIWREKYVVEKKRKPRWPGVPPVVEKTIYTKKEWLSELIKRPPRQEPQLPRGRIKPGY